MAGMDEMAGRPVRRAVEPPPMGIKPAASDRSARCAGRLRSPLSLASESRERRVTGEPRGSKCPRRCSKVARDAGRTLISLNCEITAARGSGQICHPVETVPGYNVAAQGPIHGIRDWVHQSATVARIKNRCRPIA